MILGKQCNWDYYRSESIGAQTGAWVSDSEYGVITMEIFIIIWIVWSIIGLITNYGRGWKDWWGVGWERGYSLLTPVQFVGRLNILSGGDFLERVMMNGQIRPRICSLQQWMVSSYPKVTLLDLEQKPRCCLRVCNKIEFCQELEKPFFGAHNRRGWQ